MSRDADLVIYSSAIRPGNPDYDEALRTGATMVRRADALAAIMNCKKGIVVCGHARQDDDHRRWPRTCCASAGCIRRTMSARRFRSSARMRNWDPEGEYFVAEGDESDGTLAFYHPEHAIVLNIEEEHLDYYADLAAIEARLQPTPQPDARASVFYCADDANATRICCDASRRDFVRRARTARSTASTTCTRRISSRTSACCAAASRSAR